MRISDWSSDVCSSDLSKDFDAIYMTGYGTVASYLGVPDAGVATYTDMVSRVARITEITTTPLIADADTGYGGLLNVRETVSSEEHTSELQSLMRISYAVFCLKKKNSTRLLALLQPTSPQLAHLDTLH